MSLNGHGEQGIIELKVGGEGNVSVKSSNMSSNLNTHIHELKLQIRISGYISGYNNHVDVESLRSISSHPWKGMLIVYHYMFHSLVFLLTAFLYPITIPRIPAALSLPIFFRVVIVVVPKCHLQSIHTLGRFTYKGFKCDHVWKCIALHCLTEHSCSKLLVHKSISVSPSLDTFINLKHNSVKPYQYSREQHRYFSIQQPCSSNTVRTRTT